MSSKIASASGGVSTTIGPELTSMIERKYTVSAFAVRNSDSEPMSSEKIATVLSCTPTLRKPCLMA